MINYPNQKTSINNISLTRPIMMALALWQIMQTYDFITHYKYTFAIWTFYSSALAIIFAIVLKNWIDLICGLGIVLWLLNVNNYGSLWTLVYLVSATYRVQNQFGSIVINPFEVSYKKLTTVDSPYLPMQYAGFWRRVAAYIIDLLIFLLLLSPFFFPWGNVGDPQNLYHHIIRIIFGIVFGFVSAILEFRYHSTLGKIALQIRVTNSNAKEISFSQALTRNFCKTIFWGLFAIPDTGSFLLDSLPFALQMVTYSMMVVTSRKQALHDKIAGTFVTRFGSNSRKNRERDKE